MNINAYISMWDDILYDIETAFFIKKKEELNIVWIQLNIFYFWVYP